MARRNMVKVAESMVRKIPAEYDLTFSELCELHEMEKWDAYTTAFHYGFALALRMVRREEQRARKKARAGQEAQGRA